MNEYLFIYKVMNKKLKTLHILISIVILTILGILSFKIYSLSQDIDELEHQITTLNQLNLEVEIPDNNVDSNICTTTVAELKDIHPIEGCNESDISIKSVSLDGKEIDIQAIFYLVNDNNFYTLELFFDEVKIEDPQFLEWISLGEDNMTPIWDTNSSHFLKVNEKEETKLLGIYSVVAAQCDDEFLIILNNQGEVLFSEERVNIIDVTFETEEINDTFTISQSVYGACLGVQCDDPEAEENTIVEKTEDYGIIDSLVQLTETKTITYDDYCSD